MCDMRACALFLNGHFPGKPGLASCPVIFVLHLLVNCESSLDKPKLFSTQSHKVFYEKPFCIVKPYSRTHSPLCIVDSVSIIIPGALVPGNSFAFPGNDDKTLGSGFSGLFRVYCLLLTSFSNMQNVSL